MKNMKRVVKKGFTLLELIIVMALFSILMVAVMSMADPVSRIFKNTSVSSRTYNYANDIQVYIDTKLKYADNLWVITSDHIPDAHLVSKKAEFDKYVLTGSPVAPADYQFTLGNGNAVAENADLASIVEAYRQEYYDQIVQPNSTNASALKDPNNYKSVTGKIYVMRLINDPDNFEDSTTDEIRGEISLRTYDFDSFTPISSSTAPTPSIELNPAYFKASDAVYDFNYTLGSSKFTNIGEGRALEGEVNGDPVTFSESNPNVQLSIVLDQEKGVSDDTNGYRLFNLPCTVTTNSTPLINIIERKGVAQGRYFWGANREIVTPGVDPAEKIQNQNLHKADINMSKSFQYLDSDFDADNNEASFDFTQDIFFIFSYADELK